MKIVTDAHPGEKQFGLLRRLHQGNDCPPHDHNFLEIVLVLSGKGWHSCTWGREAVTTGDVIIIRPGAWHQYLECKKLLVYNCGIGMGYLNAHLNWLRADPRLNYLFWTGPMDPVNRGILRFRLRTKSLADCARSWDELVDKLRQNSSWTWVHKTARLAEALTELMGGVKKAIPLDRTREDHIPAAVRNGVETLEHNLDREWTLGKLAALVHLHPRHLVRLFKIHLGLPPMGYLNRCRMEQAANLLLQTDLSVGDIAEKIGWLDQNYFTRRFHTHFGVAPSSYRARFHAEKKMGVPPHRRSKTG